MPRNGSGSYSLPTNSWNPATNGVPATAADWQSLINDVASAITQSLSRDGQTTLIGNLPAGGNKLTGLGAGSAAGDSLRFEQLFSQGQPANIASAATTDIGAQLTTLLNVTGTTTITSFGANYNGPRFLRFDGILTLTHGASLVLPGAANITTAAGDSAIVVPLGSPATGWRVVAYQRAADAPGAVPNNSVSTAKIQDDAVTFAKIQNITTARLLGRATAGTGNAEEIQLGTNLSFTGATLNAAGLSGASTAEAQAGTDNTKAITPLRMKEAQIQLGTAVNSTSGTAIDFTGIPSWAKRITVMFSGVSTNGTSNLQIQIGAGSVDTSGYLGSSTIFASGSNTTGNFSSGFSAQTSASGAAAVQHGSFTLSKISGNAWALNGSLSQSDSARSQLFAGTKSLSGTLDRIRITTVNGTDTFDAGSINISWE
jgi:hypothetical protein